MKNKQFLTELLSEISVSGHEEESLSKVAAHMEPYADEIRRDELGDVVCVLNPEKTPRILAAAHGDEIGLMVHYISEEGYLYVTSRGGFPPQLYLGHQVKVLTDRGILYGTVVFSRELLEKKDLKVKELSIDIGARDKEDAAAKVSLGDVVVFDSQIRTLANGRFSARALDDRLGVFIVMEAFKRAKERGTQNGVYCAATAGEETSQHGAYFTAARVEPDVAIVVDVTWASDYPGTDPKDTGEVALGKGPVLCNAPIIPRWLNQRLLDCAKKAGVEVQMESAARMTSTDGDRIHLAGKGIPMALISIPLRYMHTPGETADWRDVEGCIALLAEFLVNAYE